jgi:hypothetical protein
MIEAGFDGELSKHVFWSSKIHRLFALFNLATIKDVAKFGVTIIRGETVHGKPESA